MSVPSFIRENAEDLTRLVAQFRGQPQEKRLKMLLLLQANPSRSFEDIAQELECSPSTIRRWWKAYNTSNLEGLIGNSRSDTSPASAPQPHNQTALSFGASTSSERMIEEHVWRVQELLIEFLHQFPVDANIGDWSRGMRDVLQSAFVDVDRVTISVNANCDLLNPEEYQPRLSIAQDAYPDEAHKGLGIVRHDTATTDVAEELLHEFERQGYPIHLYHPPFVLNLEYRGAYLGTLFFWRENVAPLLSQQTIDILFQLEKFLVYAMSDVILRHHYMAPVERVFYSTLRQVASQASLTPQEHRVITYRLLGYM